MRTGPSTSVEVSRAHVLAYRVRAQGLDRAAKSVRSLAVVQIGVQDSGPDAARLAFDARLTAPPVTAETGPGEELALTWSLRGAPHVHLRADLDTLAAALWPLSEADAAGRLNETGPSVAKAGIPALEQYALAVRAMRTVVKKPMGKGAASTAVTKIIPEVMWRACRSCRASHISDSAMRTAALAAGLELEPGTAPPVLAPRAGGSVATGSDGQALTRLIRAVLDLLGPASVSDVAGYLDARRSDLVALWPHDLVQVSVDGRSAWLAEDRLDALTDAPRPELVRLLGPFDPYLQARDRTVMVPDRAAHQTLWPVLGRPGVVMVDGEVVGTWRTRMSGRRLRIAVQTFVPVPPSVWVDIDSEAHRVGSVRGTSDVVVARAAS